MAEILEILLRISLVIFMAGNLLDVGLKLKIGRAMQGLRDRRFVGYSILWGFVLCPAMAYSIARIIPLDQTYAIGLTLLGMAPCAPFLPMMVERARGDLNYSAAFLLLASVTTVVYEPLMVPVMVNGLSASAWTIAKPLVYFVLAPMLAGLAIQRFAAATAARIQPAVKKITGIDTLLMLAVCMVLYGKGFLGAVGTYAIGAQILFFSVATAASYAFSFGLPREQKIVISLGMSTRNIGAALAPLFALPDVDRRAIVMVALGVPMQTIFSLIASRWFSRRSSAGDPAVGIERGCGTGADARNETWPDRGTHA
jgi:BASS family bile acid:Na+ symporter